MIFTFAILGLGLVYYSYQLGFSKGYEVRVKEEEYEKSLQDKLNEKK